MTQYSKDYCPLQLQDVIEALKKEFGISCSPVFQEKDQFHGDRWSVKVVFLKNDGESFTSTVEWNETILPEDAAGLWGRTLWRSVQLIQHSYKLGVKAGVELSKNTFQNKLSRLLEVSSADLSDHFNQVC